MNCVRDGGILFEPEMECAAGGECRQPDPRLAGHALLQLLSLRCCVHTYVSVAHGIVQLLQCFFNIGKQVIDVFDADGQSQ